MNKRATELREAFIRKMAFLKFKDAKTVAEGINSIAKPDVIDAAVKRLAKFNILRGGFDMAKYDPGSVGTIANNFGKTPWFKRRSSYIVPGLLGIGFAGSKIKENAR